MINFIEVSKNDGGGHFVVYRNALLTIPGTTYNPIKVNQLPQESNKFLLFFNRFFMLRKLISAVPKGEPIHFLYAEMFYTIPFFKTIAGNRKVIVSMHGFPPSQCATLSDKIKYILLKRFCLHADTVIVHSEHIKLQYESMGLNNVVMIPYPTFYDYTGMDKKEIREKYHIKKDDIVISALGKMRKDKGLDILLDSLKYIPQLERNKILLNVAGMDGFIGEKEIVTACRETNVRSRLTIRALTDEEFMENVKVTDIMVLPYRRNMTANSGPMTEAIVNRIPCIVPQNGNLSKIIEENSLGRVFKLEDSQDLAVKITEEIDNPSVIDSPFCETLTVKNFIESHRKVYANYL